MNRGIGVTDILVGFVVASIIGIIVYNIHLKYQSGTKKGFEEEYLKSNASSVIRILGQDIIDSMQYASGCRDAGLVRFKYGGILKPDELTILKGERDSCVKIKEDMPSPAAQIFVDLGVSFRMDQKLAICDGEGIEWFNVSQTGSLADKKQSYIIPKVISENGQFGKSYLAGSSICALEEITYSVAKTPDGIPAVARNDGQQEKLIASDIENLKFEFYFGGSEIPLREPQSLKNFEAIRVSVTSRSSQPDAAYTQGTNSVTGEPDNYRRMTLNAKLPFIPFDNEIRDKLSLRIMTDGQTNEDRPVIAKLGKTGI